MEKTMNNDTVDTDCLHEAIMRSGETAISADVSLNQLVFLVDKVQQDTARGGAVIGNALKNIFIRLNRPETRVQLSRLGISADAPSFFVLKNIANKYQHLDEADQIVILELIAGIYNINILKVLLNHLKE